MGEAARREAATRLAVERAIKIKATGGSQPTIAIGFRGEGLARKIVFDVSELITVFGDGAAIVLHERNGDSAPYPCTISQDGEAVIWELTEVDTAIKGTGTVQLQWYVGDALAKSALCKTVTLDALAAGIRDVPKAYETWLENLTGLAAKTEIAAADAADSAEASAQSAEAAAISAELAAQEAENNGFFYVVGEDGYLYCIQTENVEDFSLQDNGEGVLEAVYGSEED